MPAPLNPNLWAVVLHDEDGVPISSTNPIPIVASLNIQQVQHIETVTPIPAGGTFFGVGRDCEDYESFGISVFLDPDAGQALDCSIVVENSSDGGATWREVDTIPVAAAADASETINRVYSVCRQHYRVSVVNLDGSNALDATEVISMLKPI